MKEKVERTIALIVCILFAIFLAMELTAEYGSAMDPVEQRIHDESMIF